RAVREKTFLGSELKRGGSATGENPRARLYLAFAPEIWSRRRWPRPRRLRQGARPSDPACSLIAISERWHVRSLNQHGGFSSWGIVPSPAFAGVKCCFGSGPAVVKNSAARGL